MPKNQLVVFGQTFTASEIDQASLMKAHDRVNPFSQKRAEGQEGAKPAVAEHDIAFEQMRPEFYKELTLVDVLSATAKVEQGAAGQRKDPHHLHEGKTTAGLLGQRLWVSGLVAGSVGHGEPGAIDHLNGVPPCDCTHAGGSAPGWYLGAVPEPDNKHWFPEKFRFCVAATTRLGLYAPRRDRRN